MRTGPSQPHQRASANAALIGEYSLLAVVVCAILFAICSTASARQSAKIPRIGYVSGNSPATFGIENAFRQGLRELGYVEGKNILVEYRYQEGKASRGPILVAELAKLAVNVLVVVPSPAVRAAKQVSDISVVIVTTADSVAMGLVDSLARPGRNITGVTRITRV